MKNIAILGATGSIGDSTLDVIARHPSKYNIFAISAKKSWKKMHELCLKYSPEFAIMANEDAAEELRKIAPDDVTILCGENALVDIASHPKTDYVMAAIVGSAGLSSTFAAASSGKRVLLANKESLVLSGNLLMEAAKNSGAEIIPVDSEHSAIFQCIQGGNVGLNKIQLTASGGPFLNTSSEALKHVTPSQACKHPKWKMGKKISIDSATLMNKGLEVIEAHFLFQLKAPQIEVVIHPQSIVHSLVCFNDGSVLSQLGLPDMRSAISFALSYPSRHISGVEMLDLTTQEPLEFLAPDKDKFHCLALAYTSLEQGNNSPGTLNAANEVAVEAFLNKKIRFLDIPLIIEKTMFEVTTNNVDTIDSVVQNDNLSRQLASSIVDSISS